MGQLSNVGFRMAVQTLCRSNAALEPGVAMKIQNIEQYKFDGIDKIRQIIVHEDARRFTLIDLGEQLGCYGLSWRSDLIEPIILLSPLQQILWIGIDQQRSP